MKSNLYIAGNASMYGNTASTYAPGIYNNGNLYAQDGIRVEDGIYISNRESVVQINGALEPNTIVQINQSDYVVPDESQAPIIIAVATSSYPTLTETDLAAFRKPQTGFENWNIEFDDTHTQIVLVPYNPEVYTITYQNLQGATHSNPTAYTVDTPTFPLLPPSRIKCKQFMGWFDELNRKRTEIIEGTAGNLTLTAHWDNLGCYEKIGYVYTPKRSC